MRISDWSSDVCSSDLVLDTEGLAVETFEPGWHVELLQVITNPNVALILMLIGIYGLIFEFAHPGSIGPGVIGAIRSEEHTSELQSLMRISYAVFCLKKKQTSQQP